MSEWQNELRETKKAADDEAARLKREHDEMEERRLVMAIEKRSRIEALADVLMGEAAEVVNNLEFERPRAPDLGKTFCLRWQTSGKGLFIWIPRDGDEPKMAVGRGRFDLAWAWRPISQDDEETVIKAAIKQFVTTPADLP